MNNGSSLSGKRALVTGASSGIGRAIAQALGRHGCSVALLARREERLHETEALVEAEGATAAVLPVDLTDTMAAQQAVATAASTFGGLDIVVNAAGVARQSNLKDGDIGDWRDMFEINVMALAIVNHEAIPYFPEGGGHILNISSMSGHRVPGKGGFYSATKFAVRAMTEGLRQELRGENNFTRVSSISPGFVDTELLEEYFKSGETKDGYSAIGFPILRPEEIADLVIHQLTMPSTVEVTDILVRPTGQKT